ncbi:hypothetical protein C8R45DRAFT_1046313 [Mycena sanguinolenta]|nr:hypothetical protein C8R45DRAFT_1046313 [Mycena sanguinolenta]
MLTVSLLKFTIPFSCSLFTPLSQSLTVVRPRFLSILTTPRLGVDLFNVSEPHTTSTPRVGFTPTFLLPKNPYILGQQRRLKPCQLRFRPSPSSTPSGFHHLWAGEQFVCQVNIRRSCFCVLLPPVISITVRAELQLMSALIQFCGQTILLRLHYTAEFAPSVRDLSEELSSQEFVVYISSLRLLRMRQTPFSGRRSLFSNRLLLHTRAELSIDARFTHYERGRARATFVGFFISRSPIQSEPRVVSLFSEHSYKIRSSVLRCWHRRSNQ